MKELCARGAWLSGHDAKKGFNILHIAIWSGNSQIMKILLDTASKRDAATTRGELFGGLSVTVTKTPEKLLPTLLEEKEFHGFTPLGFSIFLYISGLFTNANQSAIPLRGEEEFKELREIIDALLSKRANVDATDKKAKYVYKMIQKIL